MSQDEDTLEDKSSLQEIASDAATPSTEADPHPDEDYDINTTFSVPKRKRRRRKRRSSELDFEHGCNEKEDEPLAAIHQPFHRIVFDEDGNASDVVLRLQCEYQVNRKHQKRLATSSYRWSSSVQVDASTVSVVPTESKTANLLLAAGHPEVKNLEVRIHHFPNDYETVVNYWYTTLEWLDRAAMGDIDQEASGDEERAKEEVGDEERHSDEVDNGEYYEKTLEDSVKIKHSPPDSDVGTNTVVNQEDARMDDETIAEKSDNVGEMEQDRDAA